MKLTKKAKMELRVTIMRDIIKQLKIGDLVPGYCYVSARPKEYTGEVLALEQETIPKFRCDVCGIGAIFIATVRRCNRFRAESSYVSGVAFGRSAIITYFRRKMDALFTGKELKIFESAYEGWGAFRDVSYRYNRMDRLPVLARAVIKSNGVITREILVTALSK